MSPFFTPEIQARNKSVLAQIGVSDFVPHALARTGGAQTILPAILPALPMLKRPERLEIELEDQDILVATLDRPKAWRDGGRIALLVHGLCGSEASPYMVRLARDLVATNILVVRLNLRGCGPGFGKAKLPYHSGRSEDTRRVLNVLAKKFPGSPVTQVGFSLGANLTLKMAGEDGSQPPGNLDSVVSVSAPLDLSASCQKMKLQNKFFDQFFVWVLKKDIRKLHRHFPELPEISIPLNLTLSDFDDIYTAPMNGFKDGEDYYRKCSSGPFVNGIRVRGLALFAFDDPVIDAKSYGEQHWPQSMSPLLIKQGGHVGFLGNSPRAPWWLNQVIQNWIIALSN